jgi:hypothetical protein
VRATGSARPGKMGGHKGTVRNFVRRLGMMGAKELENAPTQRAYYS